MYGANIYFNVKQYLVINDARLKDDPSRRNLPVGKADLSESCTIENVVMLHKCGLHDRTLDDLEIASTRKVTFVEV